MKPLPYGYAQVCAWTCNTPLDRAGATARRHHPDPAEAIGAGGAKGASRSSLVSVITTHALFALKVQRKVSNGIAGLAVVRARTAMTRAALPPRRSSNANSLHGQNLAGISGNPRELSKG